MKALAPVRRAFELAERERRFLLTEMSQIRGLMPILMRRRNKQKWTPEELGEIRDHYDKHPEEFKVERQDASLGFFHVSTFGPLLSILEREGAWRDAEEIENLNNFILNILGSSLLHQDPNEIVRILAPIVRRYFAMTIVRSQHGAAGQKSYEDHLRGEEEHPSGQVEALKGAAAAGAASARARPVKKDHDDGDGPTSFKARKGRWSGRKGGGHPGSQAGGGPASAAHNGGAGATTVAGSGAVGSAGSP